MEQQIASALEVRIGKDQGGLGQNRQGKAYSGQNQRRARYTPANARGQGKPMEAQANGRMGKEAAVSWEMRCNDLQQSSWQRFSGPVDAWKAARIYADNLDHDEARPIGWGKKVIVEMRRFGSKAILRFEVTGEIQYRYHVKAIG